MTPANRTIFHVLGLILHVPGAMAIVSLPIALAFGEYYALGPFAGTAAGSFLLGQVLVRAFRKSADAQLHEALVAAALGWLIVPVIGMFPLWLSASAGGDQGAHSALSTFAKLPNALFESFSGYTDTGLSIVLHPSRLPHCLQWWRSLMEWIGGVGVIVLMLSVIRSTSSAYPLYHSEAREEKIRPSVTSTVRTIWWIYLLYTAVSIASLWALGMPWWEAINNGMTAISTGGFSVHDQSAAAYGTGIRIALILIMLAGATSFATHYEVLRRADWKALWIEPQQKAFLVVLLGGAVLLVVEQRWFGGRSDWLETVFQWSSAMTTTGFSTVDVRPWAPAPKILLTAVMIVGGAAGSTAGGIKLARLALLAKGLTWRFARTRVSPHEVVRYRMGRETIGEDEANRRVQAAGVLVVLWVTLLWLGIFILLHFVPAEFGLSDVIFEVASAQSNVGLSTGITHPDLHWAGKLTLVLVMWMGRLEIFAALMLLHPRFRPGTASRLSDRTRGNS